MDLSVYITELLNEHGTISISKIGVFKQVRMRGYYNADEGKLYPPYFETEFVNQPVEDDSLLQYLTEKSKVSANSAKYFMDKYLQNILQQAEIGEVMLGRLGWLSKEDDQLHFRVAQAATINSAAFGFEPVSIKPNAVALIEEDKIDDITVIQDAVPPPVEPLAPEPIQQVLSEPVSAQLYSVEKDGLVQKSSGDGPISSSSPLLRQHTKPVTPAPAPITQTTELPKPAPQEEPVIQQELMAGQPKKPFYLKPWFYGILAAAAAIAVFLYFNQGKVIQDKPPAPTAVALPTPSMDSVVVKTPPATQPIVKDSIAKPQAKAETVINAGNKPIPESTKFAPEVETPAAPVLVNTNNYKFILMSGAFGNLDAANKVVARYKAIGVPAAILKNVSRSKYVKVTLGFFKTYAEGQAAKIRLVKLKHLRSSDLYVETLRIKKK
jgi:hypothetical protein